MTPESYPTSALSCHTFSQNTFFGRLPSAAFALRERGELKSRDMEVLALLLKFGVKNPLVFARQETLARTLRCVVKTIRRSLARLEAAGFLRRLYERGEKGYLRGKGYDVSPAAAMMPTGREKPSKQAASKGTLEGDGRAARGQRKTPETPAVQRDSGVRVELDLKTVEANNRAGRPAPTAPTPEKLAPVVVSLLRMGLQTHTALQLVETHGENNVQEVVKEASRKPRKSLCGWIVAALTGKWDFGRLTPADGPAKDVPTKTAENRKESNSVFHSGVQSQEFQRKTKGGAPPSACATYRAAAASGRELLKRLERERLEKEASQKEASQRKVQDTQTKENS